MQTIVVNSSAQLESIITRLDNYNKQFYSSLQNLVSVQKALNSAWDGEANTAFNQVFRQELGYFSKFYVAIHEYTAVLDKIKCRYEETEARNRSILQKGGSLQPVSSTFTGAFSSLAFDLSDEEGKITNTLLGESGGGSSSGGGNAWGYNDSSDGKSSWSFGGGKTEYQGTVLGEDVGYEASYNVGHVTTEGKLGFEYDPEDGDYKFGASGKAGFSVVDGSVSGNIGDLSGTLEGKVGNIEAEGAIGATLIGGFAPGLYAEVKGKANVLEGSASIQKGTDQFNGHVKAEGSLLGAEAEATAQIGAIEGEDGSVQFGAKVKAGAEAYLAEGEISGGFTLFGIKVDLGLEGKAGGAGAKAGVEISTGCLEGEIGAGLGIGAGLKLKIDFTGFKFPWEK